MHLHIASTRLNACFCKRTASAHVKISRRAVPFSGPRIPPPFRHAQHSVSITALRAAKASEVSTPQSAKAAVEAGLKAFESNNTSEAVRLFQIATQLNPNKQEALAAYYNLGCAYTKQKQWQPAVDAVMKAVNDYDMKLIVALRDDDLKALRERREWVDKLSDMKGALSQGAKVDLRAEAKAPFRFSRIIILGGLTAGAGLGLLIILGRLAAAIQGGDGAPDLTEVLTNLAINGGAVGVLGFLLWRDLQGKQKDLKVVLREEDLSRLQIEVGKDRVVPLLKMRGYSRPVILAGSKGFIEKCNRSVKPYEEDLRARGVSLVPVLLDGSVTAAEARLKALKEELKRGEKKASGFGSIETAKGGEDKGSWIDAEAESKKPLMEKAENRPEAEPIMKEKERKLRYPAHALDEWKQWIDEQKELAKLAPEQQNCYIQVQLDGRVRTSGLGIPNWQKIISDLPPLDSIRTTFTDGVISDV